MNRRETLKALLVGGISGGALLSSCTSAKSDGKVMVDDVPSDFNRMPEELDHFRKLQAETFFIPEEVATIAILADIIIPKDEVSGSATEVGVPDYIEFIVKEKPEYQTRMRGGLRWLDLECMKKYDNSFANSSKDQQIEIVESIAYPKKAKPEAAPGVAFFNLMRDLTATGFYSTEMGWKDIGYVGNTPNKWNGVPEDILSQYGMSYSAREVAECASYV